MDSMLIEETLHKIINDAMNQYPWDAGYRADFYRKVATELIDMADGLEDAHDYERGPCAGT